MLAARVLCTLLLGTYLVGGYGEPVAWGADNEGTAKVAGVENDFHGIVASAWGAGTKAYGRNSTSFGANTVADGHGATAFGGSSMALGFCNTAWGYATQAGQLLYGSDKKVAYIVDYKEGETTKYKIVDYNSEEKKTLKDGFNSYWDAYSECEVKNVDQATAWGSGAKATDWHATAFGFETIASGKRSTAFGQKSEASGESATAWGGYFDGNVYKGGTASGTASTAFGVETEASGFASTAFGSETTASGGAATAFGAGAEALGIRSTAFGAYTMAGGPDSTAFGVLTKASGQESTAFGTGTKAIGLGSTAFGANTKAGQLLYGTTEVTIKSYTVSGKTKYKIVDAFYDTTIKDDFNTYWQAYNDTDLTKVGAQATAFGQGTEATGDASTAFGVETEASGYSSTARGKSTLASGAHSTAFGYMNTASGTASTAFGYDSTASGAASTAFGTDSIASGYASTAFGVGTEASGSGATAWGGYDDGSDYVKGGTASGKASTAFGVETKSKGKATTAFGVGSIANTEGSTAWGYYSVAGSESINDTNYSGDYATAFGKNSYALGNYSTAIGYNSMTTAENSLAAIGGKIIETAATNSAAIGMDAWVTVKETVALGSKSVASRDNVTDTTKYTGYNPLTGKSGTENTDNSGAAWVATRNAIAVGDADNGFTRQITGVAAGTDNTDAVNVAQLKAMAAASVYTAADGITVDTDKKISIKANTEDFKFESGTLNLTKNGKVESGNTGVVTGGTVYDALQAQSTTTQTALEGKTNVALDNINDAGKTVVRNLAKESVKVVAGTNTTVTEGTDGNAKTYAVDVVTNGAVASGDTGIVTGGTVFTETRVAADANYIKASNSAAKNLGALDTQVKKNADAIGTTKDGTYVKSTNSVGENLGALDTELAALAGGTGAGLSEVNHRIDNLDSKTNKVGAGAAALAALHPMDTDGKFGLALGYGNYRSANAMAMGLFYRPTDRVMFSIGGSMGNGENLMNVGVSFALDKGVSTSKAAMARTIKAQGEKISEQDAKIQTLEAENAKLAERLAAIEAKLGK